MGFITLRVINNTFWHLNSTGNVSFSFFQIEILQPVILWQPTWRAQTAHLSTSIPYSTVVMSMLIWLATLLVPVMDHARRQLIWKAIIAHKFMNDAKWDKIVLSWFPMIPFWILVLELPNTLKYNTRAVLVRICVTLKIYKTLLCFFFFSRGCIGALWSRQCPWNIKSEAMSMKNILIEAIFRK